MSHVFISYSRADRDFVHRLVRDLEAQAISVFFDQRVEPGASWAESISSAIERAKFLLAILSPDYIESAWAKEEMSVGLLRESEGKSTVIPIMARKCEAPVFIASKAYANFADSYELGLAQLLPVLKGKDLDEDEQAPGKTVDPATPDQLDAIRTELSEAVALFKADPQRSQMKVTPTDEGRSGRKCFIVMPFSDPNLQIVYEDVVKRVVGECSLLCERGDDVFGSNVIMDDILASIDSSNIVIADLTGRNANVFYEVGISHALGKRVILMAQAIEDVPFDLRHRRILLYEYSFRGAGRLEKALKENIVATLEKRE